MVLVPAIVLAPVTSILPPAGELKSLMVPPLMVVPDSVSVMPSSTCSVAGVGHGVVEQRHRAGHLDRILDGQRAVLEGDAVELDVVQRQRGIELHRAGASCR